MSRVVVIVDYGMGNINSIAKRLRVLDVEYKVSAEPNVIKNASKIILPGVGHFSKAMSNLKSLGLDDSLNEASVHREVPTLGICLGMQLMAKYSEEGNVDGLGWFTGKVKKFKFNKDESYRLKVPHMGWNDFEVQQDSKITEGIPKDAKFYFVHSYYFHTDAAKEILAYTHYGIKFASAIIKKNLYGVQFHPEKSHAAGSDMFNNFVRL